MWNRGDDVNAKTLCTTCREGLITQHDDGLNRIKCYSWSREITRPVIQCSGYVDRKLPTEQEFKELAWKIDLEALKKMHMGIFPPGHEKNNFQHKPIYE